MTLDPTNLSRADSATPEKRSSQPRRQTRSSSKLRWFIILAGLAVVAFAGVRIIQNRWHAGSPPASGGAAGAMPVPVIAGVVEKKDLPIYLEGIGTVQAFNTVTVTARVDGELKKVAFIEGQDV